MRNYKDLALMILVLLHFAIRAISFISENQQETAGWVSGLDLGLVIENAALFPDGIESGENMPLLLSANP